MITLNVSPANTKNIRNTLSYISQSFSNGHDINMSTRSTLVTYLGSLLHRYQIDSLPAMIIIFSISYYSIQNYINPSCDVTLATK